MLNITLPSSRNTALTPVKAPRDLFTGLPYMKKRDSPTDYESALKYGVDGFNEMKSILDFFFDVAEFQPSHGKGEIEDQQSDEENLEYKRALYHWESDGEFPPHLSTVPKGDQQSHIFKFKRLYNTLRLVYPFLPPIDFFKRMAPPPVANMAYLYARNKLLHNVSPGTNMYAAENIGLRSDWYSDAVFAHQQFIGVNPCTITAAPEVWIKAFTHAAIHQGNAEAARLILNPKNSFFVQDYSYFRSVAGMGPTDVISSDFGHEKGHETRFGCGPVVLFQLLTIGRLHPIAIILDYKGSIDTSVTIFNRHLVPMASPDQKFDWPWRYAKMCAQVADWTRHEVGVHLVQAHFLQEAISVAAQRSLPDSHIVHALLSPHWTTTLSLNALARSSMVPFMVAPIAPFKVPELMAIARDAYYSYDFAGSYIPEDLKRRGFDISHFDDPTGPYHNYAYGRSILKIWNVLHKFVGSILTAHYQNGDADVLADSYVAGFCAEMQSAEGGHLTQFPSVKTLAELINVVTMSIHIAAPQHTAINYLQQFYMTFVPNKPSGLFAPLPNSLHELLKFKEADILKALPLHSPTSWLMMAQVPYLLSATVEPKNNIVTYAHDAAASANPLIASAGKILSDDIEGLKKVFKEISNQMDDQVTKYNVLDPDYMANAIVI
ncbi:unnamed protein product [Cyclocybe aegerita]|uniref:Manganese lipoxygenase n=1 Tax=Cyclocybe aegerita TaxID=1973307 RepID=A0A8S0VS13_CYCAE|nr:unnamed protein product [Cyclocybe aegerita]